MRSITVSLICLCLGIAAVTAGDPPKDRSSAAATLAPYFQPPQAWEKPGAFRSPLQFDDGTRVQSAKDWPRRRGEILKYWHSVMGEWPPLLPKPAMETIREERRDGITQRRVNLEVAPQQKQEGWLLLPEGAGPFPAVLVVYYEPETSVGLNADDKHAFRDYGWQLAKRGFVTLNIGSPGGNAWKPETGKAVCQPLSFHAYVAANAWTALAALPQVDAKRIGVAGHSYGGKWALFAAALWDKFAAVAVSDPGIVWDESRPNVNYWEPWYLGQDTALAKQREAGVPSDKNPRTGPYARLVADKRDLTDLHALICPRPFLVSGGSEDQPERWGALNHAREVNALLGFKDRVAMTNRRDHTPDEKANAVVWAFFERFLKEAP
jgi:dienelactone hydrolase